MQALWQSPVAGALIVEIALVEELVLVPALDLKTVQAGKKAGNQHGNLN